MQGNEWIDYPIGYDNFNFVELYGTVSPKDGTIKGGTERGIWDMSVIDYTKVKTASSFNLGEDNNSFVHSSNKDKWENAGFAGFDNYYINDEFYEKLTKGLEKGEKDRIDSEINHKWGGSCYGIAMTMGLVFEGKIDLEDITEGTPENYYLMSYPKDDDELISSINYYQLSQYLDRCSKDKISISTDPKGFVNADIKVGVVRPYVGIGFGRAVNPDNRVRVTFDMGVLITGGFKVQSYSYLRNPKGDPSVLTSAALIDDEGHQIDNGWIDKICGFPIMPMMKLNVFFRLF